MKLIAAGPLSSIAAHGLCLQIAVIEGGEVTFESGMWTGAMPGALIRGLQRAELAKAAE